MGNSLQDQLERTGLVDDKQVKKVKQDRRVKRKRGLAADEVTVQARAEAQRRAAEKSERDRRLNEQRREEAEARAVAAQIRQIIEMNRLPRGEGDVAYNFTDGKAVRRLYLAGEVQAQVAAGKLAIVRLGDGYEVIPARAARKIALRDAALVVVLNEDDPHTASDGYEGYEVPDDLMW